MHQLYRPINLNKDGKAFRYPYAVLLTVYGCFDQI